MKSWRVLNSGNAPWPENCILTWKSGNLRGDAGIVPPAKPDEEVDLSVKFETPVEEGKY